MVNEKFNDKKLLYILIPLAGLIISFIAIYKRYDIGDSEVLVNILGSVIYTAVIWIGCRFLIPIIHKYVPWQKFPVKHIISEVFFIGGYTLLIAFAAYKLYELIDTGPDEGINFLQYYFITLIITFFITSIYEGVFFYNQWKLNLVRSERLQKSNLEAQYETLKHQVNPHFLFNSLNTLMTMVENNEKASQYLQKLSDFLRYTLKSQDAEVILLRDEMELVRKYIFLQETRYPGSLDIQLDVPERFYHYSIAPLSLQMLVENAIKHNIISLDKPLHIKVFVKDEMLIIQNNLQPKSGEASGTGIGLKNIQSRYKFLTNKEVKIEKDDNYFKVSLPLVIISLV